MKVAVKIERSLLIEFNQLINELQCIRRDVLINKVIRYAFQYDINIIKYSSNNTITVEGVEYKRVDSVLETITISIDTDNLELINRYAGVNNIVTGAIKAILKDNSLILYKK